MVAKIGTGYKIRNSFYYNEDKVKTGEAFCIHAENYPMDLADMNEFHKLNMLLKVAKKNDNVKRNSVHISLNFAPGEQLSDDLLRTIAAEYMEGIGFGKQPYLVYRHEDAAHPHIHLVSVKIKPDGEKINMNNIGEELSEPMRKAIEKKYGLVRAEDQKQQTREIQSAYTAKVEYGKSETKRSIGNVLNRVLNTYKFASLPELNAVLKLYNVMADRCSENSRVYQNRGLLYRILDDNGKPVGVPIKASAFYSRPTLAYLEKLFLKNDVDREIKKAVTRNAVDFALRKHPGISLKELMHVLGKEGVDIVLRQSKEGLIYGITYVNHKTCCVFNGSVLGKEYSAKGILERCNADITGSSQSVKNNRPDDTHDGQEQATVQGANASEQQDTTTAQKQEPGLLEIMTRAEETYNYVPYELRKKKKKKRKGLSR